MPKWVSVVVVIVVFLAVAAIYERWRLNGLDACCRKAGFHPIHPFVPAEHPAVPLLVAKISGGDGPKRRYGAAIAAQSGDTPVTLTEFEYTPPGRKTSAWFRLAIWPAQPVPAPFVLIPRGTSALDEVARMISGPEGSVVALAEPAVQQTWLTEKRRRALEAWTHGGQFVLVDGYAGWVTEGLLTPSRAKQLLALVAEARQVID